MTSVRQGYLESTVSHCSSRLELGNLQLLRPQSPVPETHISNEMLSGVQGIHCDLWAHRGEATVLS